MAEKWKWTWTSEMLLMKRRKYFHVFIVLYSISAKLSVVTEYLNLLYKHMNLLFIDVDVRLINFARITNGVFIITVWYFYVC